MKQTGNTKLSAKEKRLEKAEVEVPKRWDGFRLICGLAALAISIYTFISLTSYLFTWAEDQSFMFGNSIFGTDASVSNEGGKMGALWANLLISKLFGLGSFIIPFFFLGISLACLKIRTIRLIRFFFVSLFGCIIISVAFSYIFTYTKFETWFGGGAGGSYGYFVTQWLKTMLGDIGAGCTILIVLIIWLVLISNKVASKINSFILKLFGKRDKKRESDELLVATDNGTDSNIDNNTDANTDTDTSTDTDHAESENDNQVGDNNEQINESDEPSIPLYNNSEEENSSTDTQQDNVPELEIIPSASPVINSSSEEDNQQEKRDTTDNTKPEEEGQNKNEDDFLGMLSEEEKNALFDPRLDLSDYQAPPISLLEDYKDKWYEVSREELEKNNRQIVKTLSNYKIGVSKISARIGPTVTLYEIVPAPGVRVSQIKRLEEDIQISLAARGVRVVTLLGTNAIGIEVANEKPSTVSIKSVLEDQKFREAKYDLPVAIGRTITNEVLTFDLAKMPHLLVAGATGQGKSVGLNAILASLLYRKHPSELKLVLVDPKKLELSIYSKLDKHFLAMLPDAEEPVITDTKKVIYTLKSLCQEMDARYDLLKSASVRNIKEYNEKFLERKLNPNKGHRFLPYIVVVIDEFADMIMTAGREIEEPIARLAQLARACGIHLVIATQRPTTSVITGNIKANFPARIAFMVRSSIDSRTILDEVGANQLIGRGDMLISTGNELTRVQCAFIDTKEVERIVDFIGKQRGYTHPYLLPEYEGEDNDSTNTVGVVDLNKRDALFEEAAKLIVIHQQGSTSLIQRKMNLGYNRAGRIMDQLEMAGIVGPFEGSKARQVLIQDLTSLDDKLTNLKDIYG